MAETTVRTKKTGISKDLTLVIEPRSVFARSFLPDVIDQLESLVRFLRSLTDDDTTFEVISISKQSPMTAVLRPLHRTRTIPKKPGDPRGFKYRQVSTAADRTVKTLTALSGHRKLPSYADPYALTQLREFADDLSRSDHSARIIANDEAFEVDDRLKQQIDTSLGKVRIAYASFTGRLERLNVHGARWSFTIFPPVGPSRILCYFNRDDLDAVRGFVKEVVTVRGRAVYRSESPWPVQIRVETIRGREPAPEGLWSELPGRLEAHWAGATDDEKGLMHLEAIGA